MEVLGDENVEPDSPLFRAIIQWYTTEWAAWRRFRETRKRPQVPVADIPL